MSHFTDTPAPSHLINLYVSGKSEPLTGQRLAKIGYKTTEKMKKEKINALPSVCVSLPPVLLKTTHAEEWENLQDQFLPHIQGMIELAQDGIVRSLNDSSGGTLTAVSDSDISLQAVLGFLNAESTGGRLTSEVVGTWFDGEMKEYVSLVVAERLGFEEMNAEQLVVIDKHCKCWKELYSSLSSGATILTEKQQAVLGKVLGDSGVQDSVAQKLKARLEGMKKKEKMEDVLSLF